MLLCCPSPQIKDWFSAGQRPRLLQSCRSRRGRGTMAPQILADQSTLSPPGGRLCPPHYYSPHGFSDLPTALLLYDFASLLTQCKKNFFVRFCFIHFHFKRNYLIWQKRNWILTDKSWLKDKKRINEFVIGEKNGGATSSNRWGLFALPGCYRVNWSAKYWGGQWPPWPPLFRHHWQSIYSVQFHNMT